MTDPRTEAAWGEVERLFDQALDLPPDRRAAFLAAQQTTDPRILSEVTAMLREVERGSGVLDVPALDQLPQADPPPDALLGQPIGPWRLVARLGAGGMGEVYRAERADGALAQTVAIKLLRADAIAHLPRFLEERRILARLDHPGIARLFDAGVAADGRPWMAMEWVDGEPVDAWCRRRRTDLAGRLHLFLAICDAVAFAHANLVVHRDLKPGNILVDAGGRPRLLDFGIAKLLAVGGTTQTRATPYTLAYAAPEQLEDGAITIATDVHALGVVLFELLTGRRPFDTEGVALAVAVERLLREPAPAPSQATTEGGIGARELRGDLDAIVARALAKSPADRYPSVGALQADLRRHLDGEPVRARSGARAYRLGRFLKRHRYAVASTGLVVGALAAGLAGTAWQAREAARERDLARAEAARADAVRDSVLLMFREAGEARGEGEVTAKQVLERAAARLVALDAAEVAQRQPVFQALGELYAALDDFEGAAPIYRHYLASAGAAADPDVRAQVQHNLAIAETRLGHAEVARDLLREAQAYWNADAARHREPLLESRAIESQLQRLSGNVAAAVSTLRAALAERIAISGSNDVETAYAKNALALALLESGQPKEADGLFGEALATLQALGRQDTGPALTMLSNQGVAAMHLGDPARAAPLFERAVTLRRQLYGRSAALAALQHNLGRILAKTGRAADALPLLIDARAMAAEFSGAASPMVLTINLGVADAQLAAGDLVAADRELDAAQAAIRAALGDTHVLNARAVQLRARVRIAQDRPREAATAIDTAQRLLDAIGDAGKPYLPEQAALRSALAGRPAAARAQR